MIKNNRIIGDNYFKLPFFEKKIEGQGWALC